MIEVIFWSNKIIFKFYRLPMYFTCIFNNLKKFQLHGIFLHTFRSIMQYLQSKEICLLPPRLPDEFNRKSMKYF